MHKKRIICTLSKENEYLLAGQNYVRGINRQQQLYIQ